MKRKKINGTVTWQALGPGFWGIVDENGGEWRPVNMPEQLKKEGRKVSLTIQEVDEGASIFMWGAPVKVVSFTT